MPEPYLTAERKASEAQTAVKRGILDCIDACMCERVTVMRSRHEHVRAQCLGRREDVPPLKSRVGAATRRGAAALAAH